MEKLNADQFSAFEAAMSGLNMLVGGFAGSGKSFLVNVIKQEMEKQGKHVGITSTTGISALLLGGSTIHRWSGIRLGELDAHGLLDRVRKNSKAKKNWRLCDVLIIDEISMMPPNLFDKLEFIGRAIKGNNRTFGGIQLIVVGDFCQLSPVKTDAYCFHATTWNECIVYVANLKQNMRQENQIFQQILNEIRMGIVSDLAKEVLQKRVGAKVGNEKIIPTQIFSLKVDVDGVNEKNLRALINEENKIVRYTAKDSFVSPYILNDETKSQHISFVNTNCQGRQFLELAVGAQVMLTINLDPESGLVNGSRAVIVKFEEFRPVVEFLNGIRLIIAAHCWEIEINDDITVQRIQLPLILSYASTVHRCQGSTLDCAEIDLGESIFCAGQFYTALSRIKSLDCLSIKNLDFGKVIVDPEVVEFYKKYE
jgi:ATP-dependent DNA helicase PIF1